MDIIIASNAAKQGVYGSLFAYPMLGSRMLARLSQQRQAISYAQSYRNILTCHHPTEDMSAAITPVLAAAIFRDYLPKPPSGSASRKERTCLFSDSKSSKWLSTIPESKSCPKAQAMQ